MRGLRRPGRPSAGHDGVLLDAVLADPINLLLQLGLQARVLGLELSQTRGEGFAAVLCPICLASSGVLCTARYRRTDLRALVHASIPARSRQSALEEPASRPPEQPAKSGDFYLATSGDQKLAVDVSGRCRLETTGRLTVLTQRQLDGCPAFLQRRSVGRCASGFGQFVDGA